MGFPMAPSDRQVYANVVDFLLEGVRLKIRSGYIVKELYSDGPMPHSLNPCSLSPLFLKICSVILSISSAKCNDYMHT